eukprot:TRINITY_DN11002_c0_g1_i1.p1 TRINITY_DN11002_c0_g1~~TRINITY_DN11002_c0_g1_i1.p1  ORF type:complete len:301 (+),score=60.70 TRINITY_DN11002_c0_g1_i1:259-1161(+)
MSSSEKNSSEYQTFKEQYAAYKDMNLRSKGEENYLQELTEGESELKVKIMTLAEMIQKAKHAVVYTGAGVSTSSGIPDYRGPEGVWTQYENGVESRGLSPLVLQQCEPTRTHRWIYDNITNEGSPFQYCMSTNVDNLHRKSGLVRHMSNKDTSTPNLSELHGNMFLVECTVCEELFPVPTAVETNDQNPLLHDLEDPCPQCGNRSLRDIIVSFHSTFEDVPTMEGQHDSAWVHCIKADLIIVFGSSLSVPSACDLVDVVAERGGDVVIINKQRTPKDHLATLIIRHPCDDVVEKLSLFGL